MSYVEEVSWVCCQEVANIQTNKQTQVKHNFSLNFVGRGNKLKEIFIKEERSLAYHRSTNTYHNEQGSEGSQ